MSINDLLAKALHQRAQLIADAKLIILIVFGYFMAQSRALMASISTATAMLG